LENKAFTTLQFSADITDFAYFLPILDPTSLWICLENHAGAGQRLWILEAVIAAGATGRYCC
jgi:hypothetical protein